MKLNYFLFLLLSTVTLTAKSQAFLNNDSTEIKHKILAQGGSYRGNILQNGFEAPGDYREMEFLFPKSTFERKGIVEMTFFLNLKNSCFKYTVTYYGYYYKKKLLDSFKTSSDLKQIDSLNWVNLKEKYKISILRNVPVNGKTMPVYILEISSQQGLSQRTLRHSGH
jgi:hypothetical protein